MLIALDRSRDLGDLGARGLSLVHGLVQVLVEPCFVPQGCLPSVYNIRARILILLLGGRDPSLHDLQRETLGQELLRAIDRRC